HDGDIARVITRGFLLLVSVFMFLVHDDQPQRIDWSENCRTRANHDPSAALPDFVPLVVTFAGGQIAVQDRDQCFKSTRAEPRLKTFNRLRRERDFRHKNDSAFTLLQRMSDSLQINLRLAAAGYP